MSEWDNEPPEWYPGDDDEDNTRGNSRTMGATAMSTTYTIGNQVVYGGELPCGLFPGEHLGIVDAIEPDASGDQIVTVSFSCVGGVCSTQDIPASELAFAGT